MSAASAPRASVTHVDPLDHPVGDEPVDEPRDPAPRQQHAVGEDAHPQATARGVGELEQRVVLGERQAVLRLQLLVQAAREPRVRLQERAPRAEARVGGAGRRCWVRARSASAESYPARDR